ncbi:MAG TPA: hypothetical protein VGC99_17190 [Candidatus Tectomicrobia bacterium]|jgi:hypothetical protein
MTRTIIIVAALVVIAGGIWYYLGMPGYTVGDTTAATVPAATSDGTRPAPNSDAPAAPTTP